MQELASVLLRKPLSSIDRFRYVGTEQLTEAFIQYPTNALSTLFGSVILALNE
jgi:hypothetical protein